MNRNHAWDSAIWRNTIPTQPGLLEQQLDTRIRERSAVMEIADHLEREARAQWPARRATLHHAEQAGHASRVPPHSRRYAAGWRRGYLWGYCCGVVTAAGVAVWLLAL